MPVRDRSFAIRALALAGAVALSTAFGSILGGELGRLIARAQGGAGDDLVFAALGWGALLAAALALATGLVVAPRLGFPRLVGAGLALFAFAVLVSLFVGPWRVF